MGTCTYGVLPEAAQYEALGGSGVFEVTENGCCGWSAEPDVDWISLHQGSGFGFGSGTVEYSVASNPSETPRVGTITVETATFTVLQDGLTCSYPLSPTGNSFAPFGGDGAISVMAPGECAWTAETSDAWITITSGAGVGHGRADYSVGSNFTGATRYGAITVESETFTISQTSFCIVTEINLLDPANESVVSLPPTLMWDAGGCPSLFAVDLVIPGYPPTFWSSGFTVRQFHWAMPEAIWNRIPLGSRVYWRVRGYDLTQLPPSIITSNQIWWFQKQ